VHIRAPPVPALVGVEGHDGEDAVGAHELAVAQRNHARGTACHSAPNSIRRDGSGHLDREPRTAMAIGPTVAMAANTPPTSCALRSEREARTRHSDSDMPSGLSQ